MHMEQVFLNKTNQTHSFPFSLIKENIDELLSFFEDKNKTVCIIDGNCGGYKTEMFNYCCSFLNKNVLVFKINCFEGTTLDDIFLAIFENLKRYAQQKKITITKLETTSLTQRINYYLNHISLPCVIFFDSFENIINKTKPTEKEEIIGFIKHLNNTNKFKLIIAGNKISKYIEELTNKTTTTIEQFDKNKTLEYFSCIDNHDKQEDLIKLYEITQGDILLILLTANILSTAKCTLSILIEEFLLKKISFETFIIQKLMTFIPEQAKLSLNYLGFCNLGINRQFLKQNNFIATDYIDYLLEKRIIAEEQELIFVKSYIKRFLQTGISPLEKIKIHKFWQDFYTKQLPLKPNDRTILISRNTMRSQIDEHSKNLSNNMPTEKKQADMSLMSYLNSNLTNWNLKKDNKTDEKVDRSKNNLEKYELTKDELSLLSTPINLNEKKETEIKEKLYRTIEQREEILSKHKSITLKELYQKAEKTELDHDYDSAYTSYCTLLSLKADNDFYEYEPLILNKLGHCAKLLNKPIDAIDFYNKLIDLYASRNAQDDINETRIKIAIIYKEMYKLNHAKAIFENFVNKKNNSTNQILVTSYINLADIEENSSNTDKAIEYYKKAFSIVGENYEEYDKIFVAEAYYKYALILDNYNQSQAALDFYQRSIRLANSNKPFVANAFVNMAEIIKERGNVIKTVECYKNALSIDENLDNYEGIYYITLKMAQIAETMAPELVYGLLKKSLNAALKTKEQIYITNAHLEIGDYFNQIANNEKALKHYLLAQKQLKHNEYDNDYSINTRISDIKSLMTQNQIIKIEKSIEDANDND